MLNVLLSLFSWHKNSVKTQTKVKVHVRVLWTQKCILCFPPPHSFSNRPFPANFSFSSLSSFFWLIPSFNHKHAFLGLEEKPDGFAWNVYVSVKGIGGEKTREKTSKKNLAHSFISQSLILNEKTKQKASIHSITAFVSLNNNAFLNLDFPQFWDRSNLTFKRVQNSEVSSVFQQGPPIPHKGTIHYREHGSQFAQGPRYRHSDAQ